MKMRQILLATSAFCWLALLTGGLIQAKPPESQGKPAIADDDRPSPPRKEEQPEREAEKTLTVTGIVGSFHKSRDGDVDGLRLEDGTEVRFPASASERLRSVVSPKDRITIEGWIHSGESEIHAATIKNDASSKVVDVDRAPPKIRQNDAGRRRQGSQEELADDDGNL
jgi:hypothetical protein